MLLRGLPQLPDDTLDQKIYNALLKIHLALFNLDESLELATGILEQPADTWASLGIVGNSPLGNATRIYPQASVAISVGQMVNLYAPSGTTVARLAIATGLATLAHGIAVTSAGVGDYFEMHWLRTVTTSIGGMVAGSPYYLSTTAGLIQNTQPSSSGQIVQPIGLAINSSTLIMDIPLNPRVVP